jgi:deoxycytidylate deaminase
MYKTTKAQDRLSTSSKQEENQLGPELIIGLVGAVGTELRLVFESLKYALEEVNYQCHKIKLSELLHEFDEWKGLPTTPEEKRINAHMDAGNEFRAKIGQGDALAVLALASIRKERKKANGNELFPIPRSAYILWSLKHPDEVRALRRIYGSSFLLISAYSPQQNRLQHLASKIAESHHRPQKEEYLPDAQRLINRDEAEPDKAFGQNVRETFPEADVFIDTTDPDRVNKSVQRFVELLFGNTFYTPTRSEYAMFHAWGAALRSADLARQVGAVISTDDGNIVAVGTNEVPKADGGLYWADSATNHRDFTLNEDRSYRMRKDLVADVLDRFRRKGWLSPEKSRKELDHLVEEALTEEVSPIKGAQVMNLIEFSRAVHAEMAALIDAARRGAAVEGCILHTTTFPCHYCAKHIVAAGIRRVVYIEPYPKSLALDLHGDSLVVDSPGISGKVSFEPFVGIAPRRYMDLFEMVDRRAKDGQIIAWDKCRANPRIPFLGLIHTILSEQKTIERLRKEIEKMHLAEKPKKSKKTRKVTKRTQKNIRR